MIHTIGLISNATSGRNRKQLPAISAITAAYAHVHHCVTHSAHELDAVLKGFAKQPIDILAINGGDGTFDAVISCALNQRYFTTMPAIVLLPGGTANMLVGDIGTRGSLPKLVKRLCERPHAYLSQRSSCQRDLLRVHAHPNAQPTYGMCFSAGIITQGIAYAQQHIHALGIKEMGPILATARVFWGLMRKEPRFSRPISVALKIDHGTWSATDTNTVVVISSLQRLLFGLTPFWGQGNGRLQLMRVRHGARYWFRVFLSWLLWRRNSRHLTQKNGYYSCNADCIELRFDGDFSMDGECYQANTQWGPVIVGYEGPFTFIKL